MLDLKKGDTVILKSFTGMKLGVFEVNAVNSKNVRILRKNGDALIFSRATGIQINTEEGKEKYASMIVPDDGSYVEPKRGRRKKKTKKNGVRKTTKKDTVSRPRHTEEPPKYEKAKPIDPLDLEEDPKFDEENLTDDDFIADDELIDDNLDDAGVRPEDAQIIDDEFDGFDDDSDDLTGNSDKIDDDFDDFDDDEAIPFY